ncbi:MAG: hypothetical protein M3O46_20625 [Myxococcota bacterium]|nr:hypothetical protein [Myxococcota bacterium]
MAANAAPSSTLDTFRDVWVRGRLAYQRAFESLEEATLCAAQALAVAGASVDDEAVRGAELNAENARRCLAEVEAALERQFDLFCGLSE